MQLTEIIDRVIVESGQFIFADSTDLSGFSLDIHKFWLIAERQLAIYEKYYPITTKHIVSVTNRTFTFSTNIPLWVASVVPVHITDQGVFLLDSKMQADDSSFLNRTRTFLWEYRSPVLSCTESGEMDIESVHNYTRTTTVDGNNKVLTADFPEITSTDDDLLDMIKAEFMISLARSRRAFTMNDLPIIVDAEQLLDEGTRLKEEVMTTISVHKNKWRLSVRP